MPDATDPAASALQPIRDRAGIVAKLGPPRPGDDLTGAAHRSAADVPRLLKAAEDVLKLADNWSTPSPDAGRIERILEAALYECADMIREAITAELTENDSAPAGAVRED